MVSEADFVKSLGLTRVMATDAKTLNIEVSNTNRPGMQFANYWDFFPYERPQLLGKVEMTYLSQLDELTRRSARWYAAKTALSQANSRICSNAALSDTEIFARANDALAVARTELDSAELAMTFM